MPTATSIAGVYAADPVHSSFGFAVKYQGVSTFRGTLDDVTVTLTAEDSGITLEGAAKAESISIRSPQMFRDHVLGGEFFDVGNHPEVTFRSDDVVLAEDGTATVEGELTIRGTTRPIRATGAWSPPIEDAMGRSRMHLTLETVIDRTEFGFHWNLDLPTGGKALANEVTLTVELSLVGAQES